MHGSSVVGELNRTTVEGAALDELQVEVGGAAEDRARRLHRVPGRALPAAAALVHVMVRSDHFPRTGSCKAGTHRSSRHTWLQPHQRGGGRAVCHVIRRPSWRRTWSFAVLIAVVAALGVVVIDEGMARADTPPGAVFNPTGGGPTIGSSFDENAAVVGARRTPRRLPVHLADVARIVSSAGVAPQSRRRAACQLTS